MTPTPCLPPSIHNCGPRGILTCLARSDLWKGRLPMRATTRAAALRRVAVHGSEPAMSEGEYRRHVHSFADNFDIGAGFAFAGGFHRRVEFAKRCDPRGEPIGASERARQFRISPGRQVVVGPIWIFFQGSLDEIALVIENKNDDIGGEPAHAADLVRRQLVGALSRNENRASARIGERNAKGRSRRPADRSPQDLGFNPHSIGKPHGHDAKRRTARFKDDRISSPDKGGVAWIERIHRNPIRWLSGSGRRRAFDRSTKWRSGGFKLA